MMPPFVSVLTLGFLLGLRHAADADHVVAVTTIVSRERRLRSSSLIGAFWGMGHTLTIFFVGGAIMVSNVVISARVGVGMELVVAVMLIALGLATLSGRASADPIERNRGWAGTNSRNDAPAAAKSPSVILDHA
jgi:high-affinity nickel permease